MTVKQAAEKLEVSSATVYSLVASGKLQCYRIGNGRGAIRISEEHISAFLKTAEPVAASAPAPVSHPRLKHIRL